jgi:CheY-like chemotaxis protein
MQARIMVVDDDLATGKLLAYQLRGAGHDVIYLQDGMQALQRVLIEQPDLILLDVMMPHVSGWEVCREIRACSAVPIIMVTGKDADDDVVTGLRAGADDYVTKPFNMVQLQARVEAVLRRSQVRRQEPAAPAIRLAPATPPAPDATPAPVPARRPAVSPGPAIAQPVAAVALAGAQAAPVHTALGGAAATAHSATRPAPERRASAPPRPRLGTQLRAARQERGLSLYQAERLCHVRWDYLQALEREDWEFGPRAHMRTALIAYASLLHVPLQHASATAQRASTARLETHQIVAIALIALLLLAAALMFL